jgi:transposase-like protein
MMDMNKPSKGQSISSEVRKQVVDRIKDEGVSVAQAASEHGISSRTTYGWLAKGVTSQPSWAEIKKLKQENRDLLEMIGRLAVNLTTVKKRLPFEI